MKAVLAFLLVFYAVAGLASEIHEAAAAGNLDRVRTLVSASPQAVNARDRGTTPLHEAARAGHLPVVQFLIEHGANPNVNDVSTATPLRLALGYHRSEVVEYLRQHGALERIQTPAVAKAPPPVKAAPTSSQPVPVATNTTSLPSRRYDVAQTNAFPLPNSSVPPPPQPAATNRSVAALTNLPTAHDMLRVVYPIHEAARVGDVEQIKFLFKSFPDLIESIDDKAQTPLHIAAANSQLKAVEALLGLRAKVDPRTSTRHTPLHLAARAGNPAVAELLLKAGADVNARDNFESTPLWFATQPSDRDDLQGLQERDVRARFRSQQHRAEAAAIQQDQLKLVRLLLARHADVNAANRAGATPLDGAVWSLNDGVVELLLRAGANPNVPDAMTQGTPLHVAAGRGLTKIVALLLDANAAINAVDRRGETPMGHALHGGHVDVANLLKQRGGTIGPERPLTPMEQSLVEFYRRTDAALQRASASQKAQIIIEMAPGKGDLDKMFPQYSAAARAVVEAMRRQIRESFQKQNVVDADAGREIWRIQTEPASGTVREWQQRGALNRDLPVLSLIVDRIGATSRPGDYCLVNGRWVLMPPLQAISAFAQAQQ